MSARRDASLALILRFTQDDNHWVTCAHFFRDQRRYLRRFMLDEHYGGIYSTGFDTLSRIQRKLGAGFAPAQFTRKGDAWKDGSHDGRVWLYCAATLRAQKKQISDAR